MHPSQMDWDTCLPLCEFAINNAYQDSVKNTPFFLNLGYHPPLPDLVALTNQSPIYVEEMRNALELAKKHLLAAQNRMASLANKSRKDIEYKANDWAYVSNKNFHLKFAGSKKLFSRYIGPFRILRTVGPVACELDVPPEILSYDKFHVSLLKPYYNGGKPVLAPPPCLLPSGHEEDEVETIIEHQGTGKNRQYLLKWKDSGMPTWHTVSDIPNCKGLSAEYMKKFKKGKITPRPPLTKRSLKDKPSSHKPIQTPVPSRRSKRLAEALQNGSIIYIPPVA